MNNKYCIREFFLWKEKNKKIDLNNNLNDNINMKKNIYCDICDISILKSSYNKHSNSNKHKKLQKNNKIKFIDLFCGIGGFHQAFNSINKNKFECVFASDKDKKCIENYHLNYNILPNGDIKKVNIDHIPDFDILCGGFPCQAFSNAGNKQTFNDDRGLLFDEIVKIAKVKKPKFMFLENVKHILKVDEGKVLEYIEKKIKELGYYLQKQQISPHEYGVPQQRERVYFICVRNDIYNKNNTKIKIESKTKDEIDNIQYDLTQYLDKEYEDKYKISGDILKCLNAWDEMIKKFDLNEKISPTIMINEHYNNHTQEDFNKYAQWRKEYITKNKPLIKKYQNDFDVWYDKNKDILSKCEVYGKLEWQVGPIKENDSIFNYFIQIRQSGIRVKKNKYFPTLVAINQTPIYGKEKRYITPRECARLQSFPEDFKIDPDDKQSYKQFGNCVNVNNVKTVIETTLKHFNYL